MKILAPLLVFIFSINLTNAQIDSTQVHDAIKTPENASIMSDENVARMLSSEKRQEKVKANTVFFYKSKFYGFDEFMERFQAENFDSLKIIRDKKAIAKLTKRSVKHVIVVN